MHAQQVIKRIHWLWNKKNHAVATFILGNNMLLYASRKWRRIMVQRSTIIRESNPISSSQSEQREETDMKEALAIMEREKKNGGSSSSFRDPAS